jgi:3-deoxy-D-manno-octulosonic-acid transferase
VLVGPHTFNFVEATDLLLEAGAARRVSDSAGLALAAVEVLDGVRIRQRMGAAGRAVVEANRGALQRLLDHLRRLTQLH